MKSEKMIVYLTSNDINDKLYVGKSVWPTPNYLGSGTYLLNAINKYGREHFTRETLECCKSKKELVEAEKRWIALYRSLNFDLYNISSGGEGEGWSNHYDQWHGLNSERHRNTVSKKVSIALKNFYKTHDGPNKGRKFSEESRYKMSCMKKGKPSPNKGKSFSTDVRQNMSIGHIGKKLSKKHCRNISEGRKKYLAEKRLKDANQF